jgi:hypothetical protein
LKRQRALGLAVVPLAILFILGPARVRAALFSTPYDPDFAPAEDKKKTPQKPVEPEPGEVAIPADGIELPPAGAEDQAPVQILIPAFSGKFTLMDRPKRDQIFERPESTEPVVAVSTESAEPPHDFVDWQIAVSTRIFHYTPEKYAKVRNDVDEGREPQEFDVVPIIPGSVVSISSYTTPKPPPPEVELPTYGTSLSVTGRKVIGVQFSEKRFLNPQKTTGRPQTTNLIDIQQQLQLRMQGKVGPKITVNVDYDDTKQNQQDISVVYTGDPQEVVQNVSFGDIDLSLPATEFVSYNKQLFGIRADIKYKGLKASFIGSRTKGQTKSKQFFGNEQFTAIDLQDTSYVRRTYYDLTFGNPARLPIRVGSEQVFLSRQQAGQLNANDVTLTADDLSVQTSTFTGTFSQMQAGLDYTIDYTRGILTFRNQLQAQFVVAVDFIDASGNQISVQTSTTSLAACAPSAIGTACFHAPKLVKTVGDIPIIVSTESGHNRELKTFYNIGQTQIVRDNGRGNFILRVLDPQRNEVGSGLNPVQKYPDTINVDFENGTFNLLKPFAVVGDSATADPDVYSQTPISKRLIHLEYSFRFKTFFLEPNLVPQSEIVLLDNVKLNRNVDYFIDYEAGFITFFNEDRIRTNSQIDMSFEVAPFAGATTNNSLLGTRVSYDWNNKYSVGSTLLYESGIKSPTTPSITELSRSLLVYDFDASVKDVQIGSMFKIKLFGGEFAQSRQNLNLNSFALIDNMEGVKQADSASTLASQWFITTNPGASGLSGGNRSDASRLNWFTEDVPVLQIFPNAPATADQAQKVLNVTYDFTNPASQEQSVVFPFSVSGNDFSQRVLLQVTMLGDLSGNDINFRLGGVDEDADNTGGQVLNCSNGQVIGGAPKTEDINCDGILQPSEDVGWVYTNPAGALTASTRFGANNGRIDSEDLNNNTRFDKDDGNGNNFGYGADLTGHNPLNGLLRSVTDGLDHTRLDFGGGTNWHTFQIPLKISSATITRWTNIKNIRVSLRKNGASAVDQGTVKFAAISVIGNTWLNGQPVDPENNAAPVGNENLTVTPINNVDNANYTPIFNAAGEAQQVFDDLYGNISNLQKQSNSSNVSEQALQLSFSSMTVVAGKGAVVTTKRLFTRAVDISQHRYFNFLLYGNAPNSPGTPCGGAGAGSAGNNQPNCTNHTFFLRAGNDTNFFEVQVPINFIGWKKIRVKQVDSAKNSVADRWVADTPGTVVVTTGAPSLQQVASIVAGVRRVSNVATNPDLTQTFGTVFLNEIHVAEPITRVGTAQKLEATFEVPGWATFGGKYRYIDRNFQTPTSVVSNQDNEQDTAFLNFTRLSYFPMSFNISRVVTDTPSTAQTGSLSNLVNLLQQGKVTNFTGTAQGNFSLGSLPRVNLSYARNRILYNLLTRQDDRSTYSGTLQYGIPLNNRFVPKTLDLNYSYAKYNVSFESLESRRLPGNFNTREISQAFGTRLTFVPWSGSSFNPNFSLSKVYEARNDITSGIEKNLRYNKSQAQSVGFSSNYRLLSWLNPQVNYQVDILENNILNVSTFVVNRSTFVFDIGDIKTVNRNANGSISLPITIGDIFKKTKMFRSMNIVSGYQIQDGDVWNQIENEYSTMGSLWVRSPLRPGGPAAARQTQTLRDTFNSTQRWSPLEAYNLRGRWAPFKTLSLSNNYVQSIQRTDTTGTQSRTISTTLPDVVASISTLERLFGTHKWMNSTQMNYRYSAHRVYNIGQSLLTDHAFGTDLRSILFKRFDTLLSYNQRDSVNKNLLVQANTQTTDHQDATAQTTFDIRKFRFTPKVDYTHDTAALGTGVKTQDTTVITPSVLVRADLALPRGLLLPGSTKTILFSNRIIWTTTVSMAIRSSPVTVADNFKLLNLNTSADYELAKNLRMTINGAFQREWHKFLKEEDFISYQFGSTLTFQF